MLFKNKTCEKCGYSYDVTFEKCPSCKCEDSNFESYNIPKTICWLSIWQEIAILFIGFAYGGFFAFELLFSGLFSKIELVQRSFIASCLSYVMCLAIILVICIPRFKHLLSHFKTPLNFGLGAAFAVILFGGSLLISSIMLIFGGSTSDNQSAVITYLTKYPVISILIMGFVGPIVEEFTYRVGLYSIIRRLNKYVAIIATAVIFAFIHFNFFSEDIANEFLNLPSYLLAGAVLCLAYEKGGLSCSITCHCIYNTTTLLLILLGAM